jgi:hypothetical protein
VLCAVTIPPADLRSLRLYYYTVCGRMCMSSVTQQFLTMISGVHNIQDMKVETFALKKTRLTCACLVFLPASDLLVNCFVMCVGAVPVRRVG